MRVLASLFKEKNAFISDDKREELADRIEKLYQAGGMMEVEVVSLFGKEVATIRKARMNKDGMFFFYNYFEDDYWEEAGFDRENGCVLSGNIGLGHFYKVIVAAYVLEAIYTQGVRRQWWIKSRLILGDMWDGSIICLAKSTVSQILSHGNYWKPFIMKHLRGRWREAGNIM